jgi:hypothetical protein
MFSVVSAVAPYGTLTVSHLNPAHTDTSCFVNFILMLSSHESPRQSVTTSQHRRAVAPYAVLNTRTCLHFFYLQRTKFLSSELISKEPLPLFQNIVELRYPGLSPRDM